MDVKDVCIKEVDARWQGEGKWLDGLNSAYTLVGYDELELHQTLRRLSVE